VVVALSSGCELVFPPGGGPDSSASVPVVFDNSASGSPLEDFPIPVRLDRTMLDVDTVADPTHDLRFEQDGIPLAFEVESWDPARTSVVWVKVPFAEIGSNQLTLYYGPNAHGSADSPTVWKANYEAVWHLADTLTELPDSTANHHAGTLDASGPEHPGVIGDGRGFSGETAERIAFAGGDSLFDGWSAFTLELWIRCDADGEFLDKGTSINLGRVDNVAGTHVLQVDLHFDIDDVFLGTDVQLRTWTYVAYTFDGVNVSLYQDGEVDGGSSLSEASMLHADSSQFILGSTGGTMTGALDEVRISTVARDPDWILAQYLAMTGDTVTVGP